MSCEAFGERVGSRALNVLIEAPIRIRIRARGTGARRGRYSYCPNFRTCSSSASPELRTKRSFAAYSLGRDPLETGANANVRHGTPPSLTAASHTPKRAQGHPPKKMGAARYADGGVREPKRKIIMSPARSTHR